MLCFGEIPSPAVQPFLPSLSRSSFGQLRRLTIFPLAICLSGHPFKTALQCLSLAIRFSFVLATLSRVGVNFKAFAGRCFDSGKNLPKKESVSIFCQVSAQAPQYAKG